MIKNIINKDNSFDSYDPRTRPWFKEALDKKSIVWTEPYVFFTTQEAGITTASPIYDDKNSITGVIGVDIEITELSKFISNLKISENSKFFMMDNSLNMIAFPNINPIKIDKENQLSSLKKIDEIGDEIVLKAYDELLKNKSSHVNNKVFLTFETENGTTYNAMFAPFILNNISWKIGMYLPQDDYLGHIKLNQQFNIILTIILGIIFIIFGYYLSKTITKPLEKLLNMSKELKALNLNVPCLEKTMYIEINELIDTSNKMKESLKDAYTDTLFRLALASEYKDTDTGKHIKRMGLYSYEIGKELDLSDEQLYVLKHASTMHDIGKLGIDDSILMKPGKLTPQERVIMEKHSELGAAILDNPTSEIMSEARIISLYHHEKWNGEGYPKKLKGEEIPLYARIVAVADVFDALVSKRCYKDSFTYEDSKNIILEGKGTHFDPKCVEAFEKAYDRIIKIHQEYKDL